jgi:hypothetical protein|tara:strand:+ start:4314 stop:4691 length:378 start_codon:yes stop_codon:yes gene_type:complete
MLSSEDVNALGNIVNTTWGKRSESNGRSVTSVLQGDVLTMRFSTIVYFAAEEALKVQVDRLAHESLDILSGRIKSLKDEFKDTTGKSLKVTEISNRDNLELISSTSNSPRKIAYYRRNLAVSVES